MKRDRRLTARDAEKLLGIPSSTVRTWFHRTRLYPVDYHQKRPRFRESDLVALRDGRRLRGRPSAVHGEYGRYLSPWEAQKHLGIPMTTILGWTKQFVWAMGPQGPEQRPKLLTVGQDAHGRDLYYEADLVVLWRGLRLRDDEGERIYSIKDLLQSGDDR